MICEGSFTSIFIEKDGKLFTPPLSAGILAGVLRADLIETGQAQEAEIYESDLLCADKLYIGNSLRGLIPASIVKTQKRA